MKEGRGEEGALSELKNEMKNKETNEAMKKRDKQRNNDNDECCSTCIQTRLLCIYLSPVLCLVLESELVAGERVEGEITDDDTGGIG